MKKIKLITPILALATISSSLIPLASCNNKPSEDTGVKVTEAEWKDAFSYFTLEKIDNQYWSMSNNDYFIFSQTDGGEEEKITNIIVTPQGLSCKSNDKTNYEALINDVVVVNSGTTYEALALDERDEYNLSYINSFFSYFINIYSCFTYKDGYYCYTGSIAKPTISSTTKVKFNENKKISHIVAEVVDETEHNKYNVNLNLNYQHKELSWSNDFKNYLSTNVIDMTNTTEVDIDTTSIAKAEIVFKIAVPAGKELNSFQVASKAGNENEIIRYVECCAIDKESYDDYDLTNDTITFDQKTISSSNSLTLSLYLTDYTKTYTFKKILKE